MEFDAHATTYKEQLEQGIEASGENAEYFADYKARWLKKILGRDFQGKILDYGCGIGLLTEALSKEIPGAHLTGFDPSAQSIALARENVPGEIHLCSSLDENAGSFDLALLANVLHHVQPPARPDLMETLKSRLAPKGRVLIWEHNPLNPMTRRVVAKIPFDRDAVLLPVQEVAALLQEAGFEVERRDFVVFFPALLAKLRWLEPSLRGCPLGAQHVTIGRLQ